ncbi:putative kinetochore protein spc24 [Erysiphe necator]|uniref:Kinetochore protein Spc24 n=1 Tax=Uncinula necator TaxID=52586 RepID=A0A0B1PBD3_UNCNE|nr:putative kinetochore protein spc24 [Erysiphe necator]KHJ34241.1 putative kinetochore protein spc24 [Erysiphe necator]
MILDEDPAKLIQHTIENFNIQPDKLALSRINESLTTLQQARDLRVRECRSTLNKLSRTLITLNTQYSETVTSHPTEVHASEIAALDTEKFRVAKSANDIEMECERLSSQLADLQSRHHELELQGPDGGEGIRKGLVNDEITLKLKVYRGLGIELNKVTEGGAFKAIIRNDSKGDVIILNLDNKFSRFFYANLIWQNL